ncbi:MAG TPA: serine/threonine-protein kinase [Thermoanaerobaculia bacterium]|jgi:serine/threonine-protein kinase
MAARNKRYHHDAMLPLTPTKLGRYEIVDEIGKGAMGIVYLARDPLIGRLVALKTFRIGYSVKDQEMEQFRIRFMREAQSAGILTHPNIVTIHDVVEASEEGLAFIAMEYVRGTNLKLMLQGDQPLTLPGVLDVVSQVGDALDYAHANRVVHRDVKPANILITQEGRVKITDFGIARLDSSNLTQEGQLLGTPNYMAPEQIQGKEVDHRADLFSLGVVLYEMLTRHKPFQGENLTVVSHRIVYDQFTPLREYARDVPPGVDRVLNRALEKDPGRRYQRAKDMVEDLRQVVGATAGRGDDLNETMALPPLGMPGMPPPAAPAPAAPAAPAAPSPKGSFLDRLRGRSAPAPAPPAPPAADATAGTGSGTGSGSSLSALSATPPPAPVAAPAPADPLVDTVATGTAPVPAPVVKPPARRTSPRRLVIAGLIALLASALFWTGALLWVGSRPTGRQRSAAEDDRHAQILQLVHEGKQAGESGNWGTAVFYFSTAEQLAPKARRIHSLRVAAEQKMRSQYSQDAGRATVITMALANANQALAAQSWDAAQTAATTVLGFDPQNAEARQILLKAQEGQAKRKQQRRAQTALQPAPGEIAATPPVTSEQPVRPAAPAAQPQATTATLRIHFRSEVPEATVIVYANRKEVFRHTYGGGGLFHKQAAGTIDETGTATPLPAGTYDFLVSVTPAGKRAQPGKQSGNFLGGSTRTMEIYLSDPTHLAVDLR